VRSDDSEWAAGITCVPLTIQQASAVLAVPVSTLRSWEQRYDIPRTARTAGGHRRYGKTALDELRLMRDEIARGKRAAQAAVSARLILEPTAPARPLVDRFLDAAQAMDPSGVRSCLEEATGRMGLPTALDAVLMPAMRRLGRRWEVGRCDVGHEHLATEAVRTWLGRLIAFAPEPVRSEPVVLACGPSDSHTLGLEALGALLLDRGQQCHLLGARTPADTLVVTVRTVRATAAVVVSHLTLGRRPAAEAVHAVAGTGVPVFYAGNAFIAAPTRRRLPGTYLGDSLAGAAELIQTHLVR